MEFILHSNLQNKYLIKKLPLCLLFLEDERSYPWFLLVPQQAHVSHTLELTWTNQIQLLHELNFIQRLLWDVFHPTQVNIAAIGNKTPQLHVHAIARYQNDPAWPQTVWDHPVRLKYNTEEKEQVCKKITDYFVQHEHRLTNVLTE